jgi:LytS/YehU family sensor histidine kinase
MLRLLYRNRGWLGILQMEVPDWWIHNAEELPRVALMQHRASSLPIRVPAPRLRGVLLALVALAAGYVAGDGMAYLLLGEPMRLAGQGTDGLVPIVVATLVSGLGLHYFATREQLASEAAARSEAQRLASEAQVRLLLAQLEPHMLFNTLANLRSLVRDDPASAERMIDQLITYLRSSLAASRTPWTTLGAEFDQLRAYLDIMATRMGPRISYRIELPSGLESTRVAPMLLQPLVENAIRHGLEPQAGHGEIHIAARRDGDAVRIAVSDSGQGLPPDNPPPLPADARAGYGLEHVRQRLQALYGDEGSLTLSPRLPQGACAQVRFPR